MSKGRLCSWVQAPGPWPAMGTVCKQPGSSHCTFIGNAVSDGVQPVLPRTLSHAPEALTPEASQGAHSQQPPPTPPCLLTGCLQKCQDFPFQNLQQSLYASSSQTAQERHKSRGEKEGTCQTTGIMLKQTKSQAYFQNFPTYLEF